MIRLCAAACRGFILLFLEARIVGRDADKISLPRICCYQSLLSSFWIGRKTLNLKQHGSHSIAVVEAVRDRGADLRVGFRIGDSID
jgi:hypothetical protein